MFDRLTGEVRNHVDLIAERSTALGGTALGTVRMSAAASRISEYPLNLVDGRRHVEALTTRFSSLAKTTRAALDAASAFGDADIADVFTEVSRNLDRDLWFLEAHLAK
jgi:starvation-inducible DNA-binding protein